MKVFLFHEDAPEGQIFKQDYVRANFSQLELDGWRDTPKDFKKTAPIIEVKKAENASPEQLIDMVKSMGFVVMTPEQFQAAKVIAIHDAATTRGQIGDSVDAINDATPTQEPAPKEINELLATFEENPQWLLKEELIQIANEVYSVTDVKKFHTKISIIEKIQTAQVA